MKRKTALALLLSGTLAVQAADYQYLTIVKNDGSALSLTAIGLTISYDNGQMKATNGTETATLQLSEVSRMYFSNTQETTAISDIDSLEDDSEAIVYDLSGRKMAEGIPSVLKTQLRKGVYLFKQKGKTTKIQVR